MNRIFGQAQRVYVWLDLSVLPELPRTGRESQNLLSRSNSLVDKTKPDTSDCRPIRPRSVSPASVSHPRKTPESYAMQQSLARDDLLSQAEQLASCLVKVS